MGKKPQLEILQRSVRAYAICILFFLILNGLIGALLCYGPLPEKWMAHCMLAAMAATCFFMGLLAGAILQRRGLFYGAAYSAILLLLLLMAVFAAAGGENPISLLKPRYISCLFFGGIGGILGVNQKN